jgi:hypothetical protein
MFDQYGFPVFLMLYPYMSLAKKQGRGNFLLSIFFSKGRSEGIEGLF